MWKTMQSKTAQGDPRDIIPIPGPDAPAQANAECTVSRQELPSAVATSLSAQVDVQFQQTAKSFISIGSIDNPVLHINM